MGQGKQDNESAVEQAKDEQISDFLRGQYKNTLEVIYQSRTRRPDSVE